MREKMWRRCLTGNDGSSGTSSITDCCGVLDMLYSVKLLWTYHKEGDPEWNEIKSVATRLGRSENGIYIFGYSWTN
jgi:hypothetical protein